MLIVAFRVSYMLNIYYFYTHITLVLWLTLIEIKFV